MAGTEDKGKTPRARKDGKSKATGARTTRATTTRKPTTRKAAKGVSPEMIAERAYFIFESGQGGSDIDNWLQAEQELAA